MSGERTVALEVQRQVHRVDAAIAELEVPMAFVAGVERAHVVTGAPARSQRLDP